MKANGSSRLAKNSNSLVFLARVACSLVYKIDIELLSIYETAALLGADKSANALIVQLNVCSPIFA